MASKKLTLASVKALEPGPVRQSIYDTDIRGFGIRISPANAKGVTVKTFFVEYRVKGLGRTGTAQRLTLGTFPSISVEAAREAAKLALAGVAQGSDPAAERKRARLDATVSAVAAMWLRDHVNVKRKGSTAKDYKAALDLHILPELGKLKLKEVSRTNISRLHAKVSKDAPTTANRVLAIFSSMWTWAAKHDMCAFGANPTSRFERNKEVKRERFLSDAEIEALGATLELAQGEGLPWRMPSGKRSKHIAKPENQRTKLDPRVCDIVWLLLLTGMRVGEVLNLRWPEVDAQRGLLLLPDSKTGRKPVILSQAALDLLKRQTKEAGTDLVFPSSTGEARHDIKKAWASIIRHAGLEGLRVHDLRHTHASVAAGAGYSLPVIGRLLGHTQAATTQRYAHLAHDPVREAANTVGGRLDKMRRPSR